MFSFQTTLFSCAELLHGSELVNIQIVVVLFLKGDKLMELHYLWKLVFQTFDQKEG